MNISYQVIGEGPTLVLTHGWMVNRKVWERQHPLAADFRLVLWDLPQHGESFQEYGSCRLNDCAEALHNLITDLDLKEATYLGWSLGMSVFWRHLEKYGAGPFQQVVNIEMVPKMDPEQSMAEAVERSMQRDREYATRKFIRKIFHRPKKVEVDTIVEESSKIPLHDVLQIYRDMARADFRKVAASYSGKQHLVLGRHGFYAGQEKTIQSFFPDVPIHWFENSAHAPFWEEGEEFNAFVRSLL